MGNTSRKIKNDSQILDDSKEINKISNNKLFENRVGFKIEFIYYKKKNRMACIFVIN